MDILIHTDAEIAEIQSVAMQYPLTYVTVEYYYNKVGNSPVLHKILKMKLLGIPDHILDIIVNIKGLSLIKEEGGMRNYCEESCPARRKKKEK